MILFHMIQILMRLFLRMVVFGLVITKSFDEAVKNNLQQLFFDLYLLSIQLIQYLLKILYKSYFKNRPLCRINFTIFLQDIDVEALQRTMEVSSVFIEILGKNSEIVFAEHFHFKFFFDKEIVLTKQLTFVMFYYSLIFFDICFSRNFIEIMEQNSIDQQDNLH
jgi:hypothetical protein